MFSKLKDNVYAISAFYIFVYVISLILISISSNFVPEENQFFIILAQIFTILLFIVIFYLIYKRCFKNKSDKTTFFFPLSVILVPLAFVSTNILEDPSAIASHFTSQALFTICSGLSVGMTGIMEEFFFRGLFLNHLISKRATFFKNSEKSVWISILFTGITFGVFHFLNLRTDQPTISVFGQVVYATAFGICFGLIYVLANRSLVTTSIIHFLINFTAGIGLLPTEVEVPETLLTELLLTGFAVVVLSTSSYFLYRRLKKREFSL